MKVSISLIVLCTILLAARDSHAKKGCSAYGHACYGGHGKRSLGPMTGASSSNVGVENALHPNAVLQMLPNEAPILANADVDTYPSYRLIKIMKSWFDGNDKQQQGRAHHLDYSNSDELFMPDNNNNNNNNMNGYNLNGFK